MADGWNAVSQARSESLFPVGSDGNVVTRHAGLNRRRLFAPIRSSAPNERTIPRGATCRPEAGAETGVHGGPGRDYCDQEVTVTGSSAGSSPARTSGAVTAADCRARLRRDHST